MFGPKQNTHPLSLLETTKDYVTEIELCSSTSSLGSDNDLSDLVAVQKEQLNAKQKGHSNKKTVRFSTIEIHEHVLELGGASLPRDGVPVTMSWERQSRYLLKVNEYEAVRPNSRSSQQLLRSKKQRVDLLLDLGYTMRGIQRESVKCDELRKQRNATAKHSMRSFPKMIQKLMELGKLHITK